MEWLAAGALALAGLSITCLFATVRSFHSMMRQRDREREQLLDRIMHMSGKTWSPPPVDNGMAPETVSADFHWGDDAPPPGS